MEFQSMEGGLSATIEMDASNGIFEGHFPGNPIVPGVCTVQMIKELLEHKLGHPLRMTHASNIKYLGFISPVATPVVIFNLKVQETSSQHFQCSATVSANEASLCSFKGEFAY